ncbi:MAG: MCP four helix bundle domain-containing protein, partial [Desulfohalobiaceae bacterium]
MKNLRLAVKMIGGFTLVAAIVLVVGFFGWRGANNLGDHIHEVGGVRLPSIESLGSTELAVQELLTAQRTLMSAELSMQERQEEKDKFHEAREEIQEHWDRFSELPATAQEKELSQKFKQQLQSWEDLNQEWLELTRRYEDTGILNPSQLESDLHQIRGDHYRAEVKVGNHIQNEEEFEGYDNPKTCNFGLWLQEKEFDNQDIQQILSEVQDPHNKFHETVSKIQDAIQAGNMEQARRLHQEDMQQASDQVFQHFEELLEVAESAVEIREEVNQMVVGPIQKEANQANSVLNELIEINAEISATSMQAADEDAAQAQWTMVIGVIVGTILALALGILLTLSITRRVTQGVGLAQAMSKGDFTNKLEIKNQDEVGQLSQALNEMVDSLSKMIQDISGGVETL